MTDAPTQERETDEREDRRHDTLWVTDAELIRRLGTPRDKTRALIKTLDANPKSGFPSKQKLWGDRRLWRAVEDFFNLQYGLKMGLSDRRDHDR